MTAQALLALARKARARADEASGKRLLGTFSVSVPASIIAQPNESLAQRLAVLSRRSWSR
jgi:hypothetical protein